MKEQEFFCINNATYIVEKTLHQSKHSEIYLVHNKTDKNGKYIIKTYQDDYEEQADNEKNLLANIHSQHKHNPIRQHIVQFIHAIYDDMTWRYVFLMKKYRCDLFDLIARRSKRRKRFSRDFIRKIFTQLTDTFHFLHNQHIVHMDIKPENVLISQQMDAVVTDFGFSKQLESRSQLISDKKGTPYYAALEIRNGNYSPYKADIWSLGILFYMMIELDMPFNANQIGSSKNMSEFVHIVMDAPLNYTKRSTAFEIYKPIINCMLEKDPKKRVDIEWVQKKMRAIHHQ